MSPWAGSTRRRRLPPDWPTTRRRILERDGHQCTLVVDGARCNLTATDVDHMRAGDDHSDANLASLCGPHHAAKSSAEGHAAQRRERRPAEKHPGLVR